MALIKIAALLYLIIYYGVLILFRSWLLYKNTGINPIKNLEKKGVEGLVEKIFTACLISMAVIVLNFVFIEQNYHWLVPIPYLEPIIIGNIGMLISGIGLAIAIIAQWQMGNSWRLGLNKKEKTSLVTTNLFKYSRNPIYLGLLVSYIGFFMMMPNALSFTFLVVSYFALEIKIRLEEEYLESNHTINFSDYKAKVRRWL